jgi:hypothetical protein
VASKRREEANLDLSRIKKEICALSDKLSSVHSSVSSIASGLSHSSSSSHRSSSAPNSDWDDCYWSCDALSGIDDGFEHQADAGNSICRFCGKGFLWLDDESFARQGRHLVEVHAFGKCNLAITYHSESAMMRHVKMFHRATEFGNPIVFRLSNKTSGRRYRSHRVRDTNSEVLFDKEANIAHILLPKLETLIASHDLLGREIDDSEKNERAPQPSYKYNSQINSHFDLCVLLAGLDRKRPGHLEGSKYRQLCYDIACLQEEMVVRGAESVLTSEDWLSPSQREVCQEHLASKRLRTTWVSRDDASQMKSRHEDLKMKPSNDDDLKAKTPKINIPKMNRTFASIRDAFLCVYGTRMEQARTISTLDDAEMDRLLRRLVEDLLVRADQFWDYEQAQPTHLGEIMKAFGSPRRPPSRRRMARRIDIWLLGIFVNSIPTRRLLLSGRVVSSISSDDPCAFAVLMLKKWSPWTEHVRKDRINTGNSVRGRDGNSIRTQDQDQGAGLIAGPGSSLASDSSSSGGQDTLEVGSGFLSSGDSALMASGTGTDFSVAAEQRLFVQ